MNIEKTNKTKETKKLEYIFDQGPKIANESNDDLVINTYLSESKRNKIESLMSNTKKIILSLPDENISYEFWYNLHHGGDDIIRNIYSLNLLRNIYYGDRDYTDSEISDANYPLDIPKEYWLNL